ncbi:MAG: glycerol-3-phosphate dehydrogenase/oxidase [Acidimicrobiia bacterium]|nr:glycerol-3-phosphate dehydrogenase/oxidase [Acidimicrobiia bacterium]
MRHRDFDRAAALDRLGATDFDVVVVGGGITGAGVALDAASRGLRTAIVERDDWAAGTSSKSSKLIHGGLRYLQNGEIRLVYDALHERQRLRHNAPHLVRVLPFLIPVLTRDGVISRKLARAMGSAMWMYDLTGGARIGKLHKRLSVDEALEHMPTLPRDRLAGSYLYYDARADDARLTLAIVRTAVLDHGAVAANRATVTDVLKDDAGRASGVRVNADGREIDVEAAAVVNASGVWADDVRLLDEGADPEPIRPAKGVHITVPWSKVRNDIAVVIPVPKDKRSVFVVPWGGLTYIGTTDTDYDGPVDDPQCTPDDVEYLLRAINSSVDGTITENDVVGTWAGLRPLGQGRRGAHRRPARGATRSPATGSGMVTITGGKLTTYREMAADTVDEIVEVLGPRLPDHVRRRSRTRRLRLRGAEGYAELVDDPPSSSLPPSTVRHLADRYGGEAPRPAGHDRPGPRARRAARPGPPLPARRGPPRGPLRDGDRARRRALTPHACPAAGPRCQRPGRRRRRRAGGR